MRVRGEGDNSMIEQLKEYVIKNNLIDKAKKSFWQAFNNWKKDDSEKYLEKFKNIDDKDLTLYVQCIGLRAASWPECDFNHVTVSIKILHNAHRGGELGNYIVWFPLNEEENDGDDFLEIL